MVHVIPKNERTIGDEVRRLCRQQWGNINSCRQLVPGRVWDCDTWGHGGYIAYYADEVPEWALKVSMAKRGAIERLRGGGTLIAFEEDVDWALLVVNDEEAREAAYRQWYNPERESFAPYRIEDFLDMAQRIVDYWINS